MNMKKKVAYSIPAIGEAGKTCEWRDEYPVIDKEKCIAAQKNKLICQICWSYCPEAVIEKGIPPTINLIYCKGCAICAKECPNSAIKMLVE